MLKYKEIDLTKEESEKLLRDEYVIIDREGFTFLIKKGLKYFREQHPEKLTTFLINQINYSKDIKNER